MDLGRLLLISALVGTLIGCSSASQQTHQSFADRGLYQTHQEQSPQMHSKRRVLPGRTVAAKSRPRKNNDPTKIAKSHIVPKMDEVYTAWHRFLFRYVPGFQKLYSGFWYRVAHLQLEQRVFGGLACRCS